MARYEDVKKAMIIKTKDDRDAVSAGYDTLLSLSKLFIHCPTVQSNWKQQFSSDLPS